MKQGWAAWLFIAFGVLVAVFGVVAYLRMITAARRGEAIDYLAPGDSDSPRKEERSPADAEADRPKE